MTMDTRLSPERDPKLWQCGDSPEYQHSPKRDSNGKPLEKILQRMKGYDKGMCDAWCDEIEKLLIFAGLFAGAVTPFAIDSYKWLQEDNAAVSTKLLAQISLQLAAMANNSTQPTPAVSLPDSSAFIPPSRSVRINAVWFLSLVVCLSTVILGILCLQWLREYTRELTCASFDAITISQTRYEGLVYWKVPDLISFLPIALQVSVLLFFGGILDLLWSLHPAVAAVTTIAVGLVAAALVLTAIAPVVQSAWYFHKPILHAAMKQCPYKSPFSWLFLCLAIFVDQHGLFPGNSSLYGPITSWNVFDVTWDQKQTFISEGKNKYNVERFTKALDWTIRTMTPAGAQSDIIPEIFHTLSDLPTIISHQILQEWASNIDPNDHNVRMAQNLDHSGREAHDSREKNLKMRYNLLMTWFLQNYSFISNSDDLLMELRLRCLNTFIIEKRQMDEMDEMFDNILRDYELKMGFSDVEDTSVGELRFQAMATILDYCKHKLRHGDLSSCDRVDDIGQALAEYIRCTPVKDDNALMCYEIHKRFEALLKDICSFMQHQPTLTHDQSASIYGQPKVHLRLKIAASLFGHIDLCKVKGWEEKITGITDKRTSVFDQLNSFLDNQLLPALNVHGTLASLATQVRHQLNTHHNAVLDGLSS